MTEFSVTIFCQNHFGQPNCLKIYIRGSKWLILYSNTSSDFFFIAVNRIWKLNSTELILKLESHKINQKPDVTMQFLKFDIIDSIPICNESHITSIKSGTLIKSITWLNKGFSFISNVEFGGKTYNRNCYHFNCLV